MRRLLRSGKAIGSAACLTVTSAIWFGGAALGYTQESLDWEASAHFQYNIHEATAVLNSVSLKYDVTVVFSVTDPENNNQAWDIKKPDAEFTQRSPTSRLAVAIGWNTDDYQNTGASGENVLVTLPYADTATGRVLGNGAALPRSQDAVGKSTAKSPGLYQVTFPGLPYQATKTGVAVIEGHPAWKHTDPVSGAVTWVRVPVKSVYKYFKITDSTTTDRRAVVDINKCKACHNDGVHGDVTVPRLSLHGGNRTEEPQVCAVCHNPNQTDIPYRTSGPEVSIDFKRMIHSIHAGGFRETPFKVVGFQGAVTDFSGVRFPSELRDCSLCHIDNGVKGTFELPLGAKVLASTINTKSTPGVAINTNPADDLKITPTAAVCSSCHDKQEVIKHMIEKGARFAITQADINIGQGKELCVNCHGPGRERDVRRVHEIGSGEIKN